MSDGNPGNQTGIGKDSLTQSIRPSSPIHGLHGLTGRS